MRFFGGLLILGGMAAVYYLGYKGLAFNDARKELAAFFKLPASPASPGAPAPNPKAAA